MPLCLPRILCYHKVDPRRELGVTRISPRRFARQIERLAADGWRALTLDELIACARGERAAAPNEVALTFDDAYRSLRDHAFPVLEAHGFTATCFVITGFAGRLNRWDVAYGGRRFAHLAWRDMRRWQARGITFASHTATHPRLTWMSEANAARELTQSRVDLERALDVAPRAISYPFGAASAREHGMARASGLRDRVHARRIVERRCAGDSPVARVHVVALAARTRAAGFARAGGRDAGESRLGRHCPVAACSWQRLPGRLTSCFSCPVIHITESRSAWSSQRCENRESRRG